jgi:ketosteroid isomerase-like protein
VTENDEAIVAGEILAIEKACLRRWCNGDPLGWVEVAADDIVYFDPYTELRVTGKAAFTAAMEAVKGRIFAEHFELLNPLVQIRGDAAVLTYNYRSWDGEAPAEVTSSWNCTEVYVRSEGGWRLLQSHWSLTTPQLA